MIQRLREYLMDFEASCAHTVVTDLCEIMVTPA